MKTLIIVYSYHHNNTLKIAKAMLQVLKADIKVNGEEENIKLNNYDLIGFGAGIDSGHHYKQLLDYAKELPSNKNKKCFIFSTSAVQGKNKVTNDHKELRNILKEKGYNIIDEFSCKGFNTNLFLKYFGGMNKEHPNKEDINNAKDFAKNLLSKSTDS